MSQPKSVLITGCSDDGIGYGLSLIFQQQGYHVFATARNLDKMKKLQGLPNTTLLTLDVTDPQQITDAVAAVSTQTGGTLDYLINNAGRNHFMPILDEDVAQIKTLYETNVWGPLRLTQAFTPLLIKAQGTIGFITSISGYVNVPFMGTYAGTKQALELMAETLRLELAPFQVKVLSVVTGAVQTQGQTYFGDFELPKNSLYKPIETTIASRARGQDGVPRMDLMVYCNEVVSKLTSGETGRIWCGNNAEMTKNSISSVSNTMRDNIFLQMTGLDKL